MELYAGVYVMDTALAAIIIAGVTLFFNIALHTFGGGWRLSSRLSSLETSMGSIQGEIKKLGEVLIRMADIGGEIKVLRSERVATDSRVLALENDFRELRHGRGFVQGPRGIDREYP
jgi:hypothetical protein